MSETLKAIKLLRELRNRLHFNEKIARAAAEEEGMPLWVAESFRLYTETAEQIIGLLVPGEGD